MTDNKAFVVFNRIVWLDLQRGFILAGKGAAAGTGNRGPP